MKIIEAAVATPEAKVAIIIARFNNFINESLLDGAIDALKRIGQVKDENITVIWVPGAYELPMTARAVANAGKHDAVIALGTVIRGGTAHFEYVAGEASSGLASVAMNSDIPVAFGVLTTENIEQAIERAGTKAGNAAPVSVLSRRFIPGSCPIMTLLILNISFSRNRMSKTLISTISASYWLALRPTAHTLTV